LALGKKLLGGEAIGRSSEAIESSVVQHLKHWREVLVLLDKGLVLGLLLMVVVGQISNRKFSGKGLIVRVSHMIAEDLGPGRLLEFSKHGEGKGRLLWIDGVPVEVQEVITASTIGDVGKDHVIKNMCHLPRIMVECGYTSLLVITKHPVLLGPVLRGPEASLQVVVAGNLALQENGHLLHQRIIRNR
jgi:hypothetical protein